MINDLNPDLLNRSIEAKKNYRDISMEHWLSAELFRWQWWISLALTVIPLYIWWKLLDKKRIFEICVYGLLVNIISSYLDVLGSELVWWDYPVRLIPNLPRLFPVDFTVIPVVYMLVYQYYPKWKPFTIVNVIVAGIFSFLMEPLMLWMNLYKLVTWKLYFSFPIYIMIAVICKLAVNALKKANEGVFEK